MNFTVETKDFPQVDVLVAGGGPAGCAAALAAARRGLSGESRSGARELAICGRRI